MESRSSTFVRLTKVGTIHHQFRDETEVACFGGVDQITPLQRRGRFTCAQVRVVFRGVVSNVYHGVYVTNKIECEKTHTDVVCEYAYHTLTGVVRKRVERFV